ncbi:hypothetical protein WME94_05790 [Sorangium sp. So ce429]
MAAASAAIPIFFTDTTHHIDAIKALWPGLQRLEENERTTSGGRNLGVFTPSLRLLFQLLEPVGGKQTDLAKHLDALGDSNHGDDPEKFEPELLSRRIVRVEHEQQIQAALNDLQRHFADDVLHTASTVMEPGLLALAMARMLTATNKGFKPTLAPVIDKMTKAARAGAAEAREEGWDGEVGTDRLRVCSSSYIFAHIPS